MKAANVILGKMVRQIDESFGDFASTFSALPIDERSQILNAFQVTDGIFTAMSKE